MRDRHTIGQLTLINNWLDNGLASTKVKDKMIKGFGSPQMHYVKNIMRQKWGRVNHDVNVEM